MYRFLRMKFSPKDSPSTFQRVRDVILSTVKRQFALVSPEDVVILSKSVEEHLDHTRNVLGVLQRAIVLLKMKNCFFYEDHIDYLGHIVHTGRIGKSTEAADVICGLQTRLI